MAPGTPWTTLTPVTACFTGGSGRVALLGVRGFAEPVGGGG